MSILFEGPVHVYLQGKNALLPIDVKDDLATYWIGSERTKLFIKDHRHLAANAAVRIISGENGFEFADIFNQPAIARVMLENETVNIELQESANVGEFPILWLGVLDDNLMPNCHTEWEYLRPLDSQSTAITVLIKA